MVQWTGEKDAILLRGIFEEHDIKATNELCQKLAERIGEDCTMKAVKNRLYSFKSNGKGTPAKGTASAKSTPAKNGIKKATPSKTPGSNARGRGKATKAKAFEQDEAPVDDEEKVASPSAGRGLGQKRDLGDEDEEKMLGKKIKTEPREMEDMLRGIGAQFDEYDGNLAAESNDEV